MSSPPAVALQIDDCKVGAAIGSVLAMGMFATTLSFLFSTPQARTKSGRLPILSDAGQFLVKDVVLLGASVLALGELLRMHALGATATVDA